MITETAGMCSDRTGQRPWEQGELHYVGSGGFPTAELHLRPNRALGKRPSAHTSRIPRFSGSFARHWGVIEIGTLMMSLAPGWRTRLFAIAGALLAVALGVQIAH